MVAMMFCRSCGKEANCSPCNGCMSVALDIGIGKPIKVMKDAVDDKCKACVFMLEYGELVEENAKLRRRILGFAEQIETAIPRYKKDIAEDFCKNIKKELGV